MTKCASLFYISGFILIQLLVLYLQPTTSLAVISALSGTIYVSALAMRKKYAFLIAIIFNLCTLIIGVEHGIYSEMIQQPLFIIANIIGFINVAYTDKFAQLSVFLKKLHNIQLSSVFAVSILLAICWTVLSFYLGSHVWWKDGLLGGIALTAQTFTTAGNKNSWFYWMTLNILSSWTWFTVANPNVTMGILYILFFINAIIGYIIYNKADSENNKLRTILGKYTF